MITIQNGKLNIPDNDRFVGFAGDDAVNEKQFVLLDRAEDGCTYTLCLRFDDDSVCSVPLTLSAQGEDTVLTWEVRSSQLYASGIVTAQVKTVDSDGSIAHSTKDFFLVGSAVELSEDGEELEYVTPSQLRNSINQALQSVAVTAPYVDEDGYWCVFDPETEAYKKTGYHVSGTAPDSAVSDVSENAVGNRFIKQYADQKAADCNAFARAYTDLQTEGQVKDTRSVAGLPLSADITAQALANAIRQYLSRTGVVPGMTPGAVGLMGIGINGEVYFCTAENRWIHLVNDADISVKMDLIEEVSDQDISGLDDGSLYLSGGTLYLKNGGNAVMLLTGSNGYTKSEIDTMIGDVESLLQTI